MTTDIRNLALQLRAWSEPIASGYEVPAAARTLHAAAAALEAMAGEIEQLSSALEGADQDVQTRLLKVEAERDRLQLALSSLRSDNARMKAALEEIADITQYLGGPTLNKIDDAFQRGLIAGHETCAHIARKALGGDA